MPWVTPADPPGDKVCYRVTCPSGVDYEAALKGAIYELGQVHNWQNVNGQTEEIVSQAFFDAFQVTLEWSRCVPIGALLTWASDTIPDGWLLCDGSVLAQVGIYSDLFDVIGTTFGGGTVNFRLPNFDNRFAFYQVPPVPIGNAGGNNVIFISEAQLPSHGHSIPGTVTTLNDIPVGVTPVLTPSLIPGSTGNTGSGDAIDAKPPFLKMRMIIRYK